MVQIEPRFSLTAAKADQWIPIEPGTDGALALGIAHWIIKEKKYDHDFINHHAFGFDDWKDSRGEVHTGFKTLVLTEYSPEQVSSVTGIPEETVIQIAKEFSSHRSLIAISGEGWACRRMGLIPRWPSIASMPWSDRLTDLGIVTSRRPPFQNWPPVQKDSIAEKGLSQPRIDGAGRIPFPFAEEVPYHLPESIERGKPYPIDTLFLYYTNPLFSIPGSETFRTALEKVPFIVSFSPFMDETTMLSDLILPDGTYLERWQDDHVEPGLGFPMFGLRSPAIQPLLYDVRNTGDVLIEIAKKLGGNIGKAFPWKDFQEALREAIKGVYSSREVLFEQIILMSSGRP